jgi:hypothetical protein
MKIEFNARRLLDDDVPQGYLESDKDFVLNNFAACVRWLEIQTNVPKKRK